MPIYTKDNNIINIKDIFVKEMDQIISISDGYVKNNSSIEQFYSSSSSIDMIFEMTGINEYYPGGITQQELDYPGIYIPSNYFNDYTLSLSLNSYQNLYYKIWRDPDLEPEDWEISSDTNNIHNIDLSNYNINGEIPLLKVRVMVKKPTLIAVSSNIVSCTINNLNINNINGLFQNNRTLKYVNFSGNETITSMNNTFNFCMSLLEVNNLDYSNVKEADSCFNACTSINNLVLNSSELYDGTDMFNSCTSLSNISIDTSSLINGHRMFSYSGITDITLDAPELKYAYNMFESSQIVNASILNTSLLQYTNYMFNSTSNLESVTFNDLSSLVDFRFMFASSDVKSITFPDLSSVNIGISTFQSTYSLSEVTLPNTSSLTDASLMFSNSSVEIAIFDNLDSLNDIDSMFYNSSLTCLPYFDTRNVLNTANYQPFLNCNNLNPELELVISLLTTNPPGYLYIASDTCENLINTTNDYIAYYELYTNSLDSTGTYNGTDIGGITYNNEVITNGINSYIDFGNILWFGDTTSQVSINVNIKGDFILSTERVNSNDVGDAFFRVNSTNITFRVNYSTSTPYEVYYNIPHNLTDLDTTYHNFTFIKNNNSTFSAYVDGVLLDTINTGWIYSGSVTQYSNVELGRYRNSSWVTQYYAGSSKNLRIYNRILEESEIQYIVNSL